MILLTLTQAFAYSIPRICYSFLPTQQVLHNHNVFWVIRTQFSCTLLPKQK